MRIDGYRIGSHAEPFVIAEISGNHNGDIIKAKELIAAAASIPGVAAVKLQTYEPSDFVSNDHPLHQVYSKLKTPREWHHELFEYARKLHIAVFSTAFSPDAVDFLVELGTPALKISSFEINRDDILHRAISARLPLIISTGLATEGRIAAINHMTDGQTLFLHCVSQYPTALINTRLGCIKTLQKITNLVGVSDHTSGYESVLAAVAMGAVAVEKHLKLDDNCADKEFSLLVDDFAAMVRSIDAIWYSLQSTTIQPTSPERSELVITS